MDREVIISHGLYEACIRLFEEPAYEMVGSMSVKNPEGEHLIKLVREDLENIQETINEYLEEKFSC
jgi:hypothetical protein